MNEGQLPTDRRGKRLEGCRDVADKVKIGSCDTGRINHFCRVITCPEMPHYVHEDGFDACIGLVPFVSLARYVRLAI